MASIIDKQCVSVPINGHMLAWLAKTDGADGEFIRANRHPSGGNCFVLTTADGKKLAGGNGSHGAETALHPPRSAGRCHPAKSINRQRPPVAPRR